MVQNTPLVLCILDGWGYREASDYNAISAAHTPNWDALWADFPHTLLEASESHVGLPDGQMGNSEVGHMHIGAGRILPQDLPRIDAAIADGSLQQNPTLQPFIAALNQSHGTCHLMGLASDGGVHAHFRHMLALADVISEAGVPVCLHLFLDGRDTPPNSAGDYLASIEAHIRNNPRVHIASLSGRYYAMDRDKRWDRIALAYQMLTGGEALTYASPAEALQHAYEKEQTSDEFVLPRRIKGFDAMQSGDGLLMANFRADRAREIISALLDPGFADFPVHTRPTFAATLGMVEYSESISRILPSLFPPLQVTKCLGEVISHAGLKQLRLAETEKYAHVTFFMNAGREAPFPGEVRQLIPSPAVATYDLQPEMSAREVTNALITALNRDDPDVIVVNFANPDMVGHTGDFEAAVKAVETIDGCIGDIVKKILEVNGGLMITADHGNVEQMMNADGSERHTAHTTNPVPLLWVAANMQGRQCRMHPGSLIDIAPTILSLLGVEIPKEMTGKPLMDVVL